MIKINLLTEVKEKYGDKGGGAKPAGEGPLNINNILIVAMIVVGLAYSGFVFFQLKAEKEDLAQKIAAAEQEKNRLQKVLEEVARFEKKKADLQRKIDLINDLKRNQKGPVRVMDEISRELPDLLWLDNLDFVGDGLRVRGRALNLNAIGTFIDNVKGNQYFDEPVLQDINLTGGPSFAFSMTFRYQPPLPEGEEAEAEEGA